MCCCHLASIARCCFCNATETTGSSTSQFVGSVRSVYETGTRGGQGRARPEATASCVPAEDPTQAPHPGQQVGSPKQGTKQAHVPRGKGEGREVGAHTRCRNACIPGSGGLPTPDGGMHAYQVHTKCMHTRVAMQPVWRGWKQRQATGITWTN